MSTHPENQLKNLKELFGQAAAKERRILLLSMAFTFVVIAGGFVWIAYSANKVINLEKRRTTLEAANKDLEDQINRRMQTLQQMNEELGRTSTALTNVVQGKGDPKKEARSALASVSNVQERVQGVIDQPTPNRPIEGASPTPTPPTIVPDVKGQSLANARQKIRQAQLNVTQRLQEGNGVPGTVLYQDPISGTRVPVGSSVIVYVSPVLVPDLIGLTVAVASQRIRDAGFVVTQKPQEGRGTPGTVLYQDPVRGTRLPAGTSVIIYVIPGPK